MISFLLCLALLIAGYFIYGRMAERLFGPDDRLTPVRLHPDGEITSPCRGGASS